MSQIKKDIISHRRFLKVQKISKKYKSSSLFRVLMVSEYIKEDNKEDVVIGMCLRNPDSERQSLD